VKLRPFVLGTSSLQALPILLPPIEEQQLISEALRACDHKITALEQEAVFLDELFRAILEELMAGRLSALPLVEAKALN
jgi:type I restriction enzyme S subunit